MNNHNVETCRKKETTVATIEVTPHSQKPQKTFSYAYHIWCLNGHRMIDCPKFAKMQKMCHGKFVIVAKVQHVVKVKIIIVDVNVVDVNVTTRSNATKEHVFKDRKLRKTNNDVD
jgi:hypothetical protein